MAPQIHSTKDGSSTLYSEEYQQYYHNPNGAASESQYVFFEASGLMDTLHQEKEITIFEMGFGTGLNFLLLLDHLKALPSSTRVCYQSIEAYPLDRETAAKLNFKDHLRHPELNELLPDIFDQLKPGANTLYPAGELEVELRLFSGFFNEFPDSDLKADYFFYDPFSPEVNPELWNAEVFKQLIRIAQPNAMLSTYCAASKARGAMCAAGWYVARERGALGKREMTLASPNRERLGHLKRVNEKRLAERYLEGDFDP